VPVIPAHDSSGPGLPAPVELGDLLEPFARRGVDLGLERIRAALAEAGDPQRRFAAVQVAGTNGKGSICTMLHAILRAAGLHCGTYRSPHLVSWCERIRIDEAWIAPDTLRADLARWQAVGRRHALTPFELLTAAAFDRFAREALDLVVLEVGLGGRLDATTAHPERLVLGFGAIGLDHCEQLGDSLAAIATEKAGVLSPGSLAFSAAQEPEVAEVLEREAQRREARLEWVEALPPTSDGGPMLGLAGDCQRPLARAAGAAPLAGPAAAAGWRPQSPGRRGPTPGTRSAGPPGTVRGRRAALAAGHPAAQAGPRPGRCPTGLRGSGRNRADPGPCQLELGRPAGQPAPVGRTPGGGGRSRRRTGLASGPRPPAGGGRLAPSARRRDPAAGGGGFCTFRAMTNREARARLEGSSPARTVPMTLELTSDERNKLLGGPLAAALAVMTVDMGIVSSAQEAIALGKELAGASARYASNPLITSLFDPEALKKGLSPEKLQVTPEDVRNGKVLDRALEEVDAALALARTKADEATVQEYARLIVEGCEAVAAAAGKGLFGSGEKVSPEEKAALDRIRQHLGVSAA
jgi:dihydrofolate synthase/folylpolyglutamate synthase